MSRLSLALEHHLAVVTAQVPSVFTETGQLARADKLRRDPRSWTRWTEEQIQAEIAEQYRIYGMRTQKIERLEAELERRAI